MESQKQKVPPPPPPKQALDGTRLNAFGVLPENLTIVGLDTQDGKEHMLYDGRVNLPLDEGLVKNIMVFGVLQAILVRKNGPLIEVVDGRQRVRATREANRRLVEQGAEPHAVPCFVKRGEDLMGVMISTFVRIDDGPLAKAQKCQRYMDTGKGEADAAIVYGVSTQTVRGWLGLLDLAPEVQRAVQHGKVAATAALELRDLVHKDQIEKLAELLGGVKKSGAAVELKRQRQARQKGDDAVVRSKVVSRDTLRKLAVDDRFIAKAESETQALLLWILGEGNGGPLSRVLRKITKPKDDTSDTSEPAE
jgi:ParB family chromosome partitioning protein